MDLNLDFAGNLADSRFNSNSENYLGEWNKEYLYENLTNYASLVLLSDGEAHSLALLEGMMAGLGIVISEYSTANLDLELPFIDVVPEDKIQDEEFIKKTIEKNREVSVKMRKEIRKYTVDNFSWENVVKKYDKLITNLTKI